MSDLIAIAYDDRDTAENVRSKLFALHLDKAIRLEDAVVVTRDDQGKVKLHQSFPTTRAMAGGGALWGGVIGLLFLAPVLGAAIGGTAAAATGAMVDLGVDDDLLREIGSRLEQDNAALIVLISEMATDELLSEIEAYGGHVMQTSLNAEGEARLGDALGAVAAAN